MTYYYYIFLEIPIENNVYVKEERKERERGKTEIILN